jgi:hypothetical protein
MTRFSLPFGRTHAISGLAVAISLAVLSTGCDKKSAASASGAGSDTRTAVLTADPMAMVGEITEIDAANGLLAVAGLGYSATPDGTVFVIVAAERKGGELAPLATAEVANRVGNDLHLRYTPTLDAKGKKQRAPAVGDLAVRLAK